jgi:hypothetical protein
MTLQLIDLTGKSVFVQTIEGCTGIIDLSGLSNGMYLYTLKQAEQVIAHGKLQVLHP